MSKLFENNLELKTFISEITFNKEMTVDHPMCDKLV